MSLLIDAIKKAEEGKNDTDSTDGTAWEEPALELEARHDEPPHIEVDDRAAAKKLFAVKAVPDDHSKIWILAGIAALLLAGGAVYYWYQIPVRNETVIAQLPPPLPLPVPQAPPQKISDVAAVAAPRTPEKSPPRQQEGPVNSVRIQKSPAKAVVNPLSVSAYEAMMSKNLVAAHQDYGRLLRRDPQNREALLGLAAIALKRGRTALAERYYTRVLEIDPEDPDATASLVNMRNPSDGESRLKTLLRDSPDSGALYFSLGNRYASQSLWADAQQAYFDAYASEPGNPDFAFNLAVSLDHLSQNKLAIKYYRRALSLSGKGFPGFDPAVAASRIHELEK